MRPVGKQAYAWLAGGRKRHYTFARRVFPAFLVGAGKVNKPLQGIDSLSIFR